MGQELAMQIETPHSSSDTLMTIDNAIAAIQNGEADSSIQVDLGGGRVARVNSDRGLDGLLQRLKGHKTMMALMESASDISHLIDSSPLHATEEVLEILDAATAKR